MLTIISILSVSDSRNGMNPASAAKTSSGKPRAVIWYYTPKEIMGLT